MNTLRAHAVGAAPAGEGAPLGTGGLWSGHRVCLTWGSALGGGWAPQLPLLRLY